ncbi:ATP-dependent helicase HrpB [Litorivivens lipolytica]|uniref:ATP-dependent helicase HrpB n=1 Tax=Litorivivens lipolytica TaxID=1524264 RepID=A0A7W4W4J9_9GAMM|nr:ATP-dependent helicase HrpB [Litorivivens lipolytica]MBB3047038.1 ATP-dependent helicase HrpB [Litorivivens lipolytica]
MSLPIEQVLPELKRTLNSRHEAIVVAEPGAGKTTRIPLALLTEPWLAGQKILLLEPRRLAAKLAAQRMAESLGESVGETVGYRMRLEQKEGPRTRIMVITEGVLSRMLLSDPSLEGVGLVIFDEFHERSVDADLGLALSLYARDLFRDDSPLKLLVMSATLDSEALAELLQQAPIVRSEGRQFPVARHYGQRVEQRDVVTAVSQQIRDCLRREQGSLLVFLPGQGEIRAVQKSLQESESGSDVLIAPLYGSLSLQEQQQAVRPPPEGKRKVVLATDIAESSLTIEGVTVVVDSGWARKPEFDPRRGMSRLQTKRISRASAEQRAGRAGRLAPGAVYRLWSEDQQKEFPAFDEPEIQQADLAPLALQLLVWGVDVSELNWLDAPRPAPWQQALDLLRALGACDTEGALTPHGEAMAALPTHPRLAHMLINAHQLGLGATACELAAILSDRDPLRDAGADLSLRLPLSNLRRGSNVSHLQKQAGQFTRLLKLASGQRDIEPDRLGLCLALAYPDRIARRREGGAAYLLANGRAAELDAGDSLGKQDWLVVAESGGHSGRRQDRIFLAARFNPSWLGQELPAPEEVDVVEWQADGQLLLERQQRIGQLIVGRERSPKPDDNTLKNALLNRIREQGLAELPWNEVSRQWQARVMLLRELDLQHGESSAWPDVSNQALLDKLESWLLPFLPAITHARHLQKLDLMPALQSLLVWPQPRELDELAPVRLTLPTGSEARIDYQERPPVLAVKLQEMFGQQQSPRIAGGRQPVTLHLLSPAGRPLQVTQDLASFWANSYSEVKKDMKGRYPKHPWPDDPISATPMRGTKKQGY